jgi:hypothetical protein
MSQSLISQSIKFHRMWLWQMFSLLLSRHVACSGECLIYANHTTCQHASCSVEVRLFDHAKGFPTNYRQKLVLQWEQGTAISLAVLAENLSLSGGCIVCLFASILLSSLIENKSRSSTQIIFAPYILRIICSIPILSLIMLGCMASFGWLGSNSILLHIYCVAPYDRHFHRGQGAEVGG